MFEMKLNDGDRIVTAWAENARGPGWSNQIVWVLVRERGGRLREESIQPGERTVEISVLHDVSALVSQEMTALVRALTEEKGA